MDIINLCQLQKLQVDLPQVLQKNIWLFSFLSQLAQEGKSSYVDSIIKRIRLSDGGRLCPSLSWVIFLKMKKRCKNEVCNHEICFSLLTYISTKTYSFTIYISKFSCKYNCIIYFHTIIILTSPFINLPLIKIEYYAFI